MSRPLPGPSQDDPSFVLTVTLQVGAPVSRHQNRPYLTPVPPPVPDRLRDPPVVNAVAAQPRSPGRDSWAVRALPLDGLPAAGDPIVRGRGSAPLGVLCNLFRQLLQSATTG